MEKSPFSRLRKGKATLTMLHEVTEKKQKFQDKWTFESWCRNLRSWSSLCNLNANKGLGSMVSKCAQISTARWTVCSGLEHLQQLMVIILCKKMIKLSYWDNMSWGHFKGLWLMPCQPIQKNPLQSSIHLGNSHHVLWYCCNCEPKDSSMISEFQFHHVYVAMQLHFYCNAFGPVPCRFLPWNRTGWWWWWWCSKSLMWLSFKSSRVMPKENSRGNWVSGCCCI